MHHGVIAAQPTGIWEYFIVSISIIVFLLSLYLCIRFFVRPGEGEKNHIKNKILEDDVPRAGR